MEFDSKALVVKISVSNMLQSKLFYERVLGFKIDDKYTINAGGVFADTSYMQLNLTTDNDTQLTIGLYKDIDAPYKPIPETGTVPSFIVNDLRKTLRHFQALNVVIDKMDDKIIMSNTSDEGFEDHFFFFRDPDNNSLVVRENIPKS